MSLMLPCCECNSSAAVSPPASHPMWILLRRLHQALSSLGKLTADVCALQYSGRTAAQLQGEKIWQEAIKRLSSSLAASLRRVLQRLPGCVAIVVFDGAVPAEKRQEAEARQR